MARPTCATSRQSFFIQLLLSFFVACSTQARQNSLGESFVSDSDVGFIPLLLQMDHWRMRKRNVRALNLNPILCSYSIHPGVILFLSFFFF